TLSEDIVQREQIKVDAAELEQEFVDECYFPVAKLLTPAIEKAASYVCPLRVCPTMFCHFLTVKRRLDKDLFSSGLERIDKRVGERFYTTALAFAHELGDVINAGIVTTPVMQDISEPQFETTEGAASKNAFLDIRE